MGWKVKKYSCRGTTYNIPVCVWLQESHPYIPPLVYVKPTNNMGITVSKHVDASGKVYHPYLTEWTYPKSDLAALLQLLSCIFAEKSPVYAKQPEPQPPSGYRPPHQGQFSQPQFGSYPANPMGSTPYPVRGPGMMPAGGISGGQSTTPYPVNQPNFSAVSTHSSYRPHTGYPPPSTSTGANVVTSNPVSTSSSSNDDAAVKASLRTAIELDQLNRTQMQLKEGSEKLKDILQKLEKEQADVDNDIKLLTQKNEEITVVVSQLESNSSNLDIDDAVVTTAPLYNQMSEYCQGSSLCYELCFTKQGKPPA
ncbi:Tumor susceptibility gene 101 protein [Acropora cervicornis]|uniref:Tumor susceptibility gene 101 protein n=1 Tax=Acropora cervicornis TaxID=6130 RepID=A0AAD9V8L4_ACRCE|nr:Tumor susceptibility gene 101 protein [Acropora cervicornis]